jgi:hypothetical protein
VVLYSLTCAYTSTNAVAVTEQYACTFANSNPYTYTSTNSDINSHIAANGRRGRICTSPTSSYPYSFTDA